MQSNLFSQYLMRSSRSWNMFILLCTVYFGNVMRPMFTIKTMESRLCPPLAASSTSIDCVKENKRRTRENTALGALQTRTARPALSLALETQDNNWSNKNKYRNSIIMNHPRQICISLSYTENNSFTENILCCRFFF